MVRGVGRDIGGFAGADDGFHAAESDLDLAFENTEHLLEIVAMGRRAATGRDEHVEETVATGGVSNT